MILSHEQIKNNKEIIKFGQEVRRQIMSREFKKASARIDEFKEKLLEMRRHRDFHYYFYLIKELGWLRQEVEATQRNKIEFEEDAKEFITYFNELIISIILNLFRIKKFVRNEKEYLIEEADKIMDPIFLHIQKEAPEYTSFTEIKLDKNYYQDIYKKLIKDMERNNPTMKNEILEYRKWRNKKNLKIKKLWGINDK